VDNGIFLEQVSTGASIVRRTKTSGVAVDTAVAQTNWNLDKLDGSGTSGITLDLSKAQILVIDLQWLGTGRVRVGFDIGGTIIYAHQFLNSNSITTVYMTTANLPLRYELEATGAIGASTTMKQICSSVISEGGFEEGRGLSFSASNPLAGKAITTRAAVITIRPKSTFNSIPNRGQIILDHLDTMVVTNNAFYEIVYNGTLGGTATYTSVDANSLVEFDTASTTVSGGTVIESGYLAAGAGNGANAVSQVSEVGLNSRLAIALNAAGNIADTITFVATAQTGTSTVNATFEWKEIR